MFVPASLPRQSDFLPYLFSAYPWFVDNSLEKYAKSVGATHSRDQALSFATMRRSYRNFCIVHFALNKI